MKDKIAEINKEMRDGINHWAYFMIMANSDQVASRPASKSPDAVKSVICVR